MADYPYIPWFVRDYLADTPPVAEPNWEHHGIYCLLLMKIWLTPKKSLPNDPKWIARQMGCSEEVFENKVKPVLQEYFKCDGNSWKQKRISKEWNYLKKQSRAQSVRAKSRWQKEKEVCPEDDPAMPNSSLGNAPTRTRTRTIKEKEREARGTRLPPDWYPDEDLIAWARKIRPDIDIDTAIASFKDYWTAKTGQAATKLDWNATFRNWIRKEKPNGHQAPGRSPTKDERARAAIARAAEAGGFADTGREPGW